MEVKNIRKKTSKIWTTSKEDFTQIVKDNYCIRDIVVTLGYSRNSGSIATMVKERIAKEKIDTSHFKGRLSKTSSYPKYETKDILIKDSPYTNITSLKKRLVKEGLLEYKCVKCGNKGEWNDKPLTLQLDHINGDNTDHRLKNVRFLCPNCHSQTKTFSGRNVKRNT